MDFTDGYDILIKQYIYITVEYIICQSLKNTRVLLKDILFKNIICKGTQIVPKILRKPWLGTTAPHW